jgi:antirestriction protein
LQKQISEQQSDLQEQISRDQNQLQKLIAEKDVQVALYQHRMNCYLQVMQVLDIICHSKIEHLLQSLDKKSITDYVAHISNGRDLIFKSLVESEALFDISIVQCINGICTKFDQIYSACCDAIMISDDEFARRKKCVYEQLNISKNLSDFEIITKYNEYFKTKEGINFATQIYPEIQSAVSATKELSEFYKMNNELFKLIKPYVQFEKVNV